MIGPHTLLRGHDRAPAWVPTAVVLQDDTRQRLDALGTWSVSVTEHPRRKWWVEVVRPDGAVWRAGSTDGVLTVVQRLERRAGTPSRAKTTGRHGWGGS